MAGERFGRTTFVKLISEGVLEIGDGYRAKNEELGGDGLMFLRAGHVTDTHINFDGVERFHVAFEPRVQSKVAKPGDAVITTKGNSTGRTTYVTPSMPPFVYSPHLSYWRSLDPSRVEGGFLRYWSKGPEFTEQLAGMKASTDMAPYLSLIDQKRLGITLPPIGEQRAIAQILGTLDDKIDLNRRMNETLEAMVRALFKSWFVDFGPVRAKGEGRDPGLPKPLADLFPARLVDSELGEIPEGWEIKPIGDLADVLGGTTPSTKESSYWEGGEHAWATPKDLSGLLVPVLLGTERRITDAGLSQVGSGLLPKGTILLSSRAPIGYLAVAELPVAINQGFIAMVAKAGTSNLFLLLWASVAHEDIVSRANGSTFLEISKANFRPIPIVTPSAQVMLTFEKQVRPLYERIVESARESRSLAALRDSLLPRLISGELRVRGA
ncbi:MAG: restriction endonuclease subunit S [Accumulibacter sp.]|jgi:type I restriction enzyme S subunit|uniref:restriction endonuclease subunit S n=1 Tax=Accumulibacter sp. TaxID=2053492 RepID=UPI002FC28793